MFNLKSILIALTTAGALSCSTAQDENKGPEEGTSRTASVALAADAGGDLAVYVFNKSNDRFAYQALLNEGWTERDNKKVLFKEMIEGDYKFLFLGSPFTNLSLPEIPVTRSGELYFEDMIISHKVVSSKEGCFSGADEFYMQDDADLADLPHAITANKVIEANLTRAVAKIDVQLGRGYKSGTDDQGRDIFTPVPFTNGKTMAELFKGYEIEVTDCGDHLAIRGCTGKANVYEDYTAGHEAIRTIQAADEGNEDGLKTGFALLSGPFILPPAEDSDMKVRVKLIPADGVDIPGFETQLVNGVDGTLNIPRNHKLTITLWLDTVSPTITVSADVSDMKDENTGDAGIWN